MQRGNRASSVGRDQSALLNFKRCSWASSSAGRAPRSQRGGRGFESPLVHHNLKEIDILADPPKFDQVAKVANWGFRKLETSPNVFSPFEPKITFLEQSCVTLRDVSLRMTGPEVLQSVWAIHRFL